jgi:hypothetical protein
MVTERTTVVALLAYLGRWSRHPNMSRNLQTHNWKCDPSEEAELDAEALPWQVTWLDFSTGTSIHLFSYCGGYWLCFGECLE